MSSVEAPTQDEVEVIVRTSKPAPSKTTAQTKPKPQPQYAVIVLNDDLHTFAYVIDALSRICGHSQEQAYRLALEIDSAGLAVVWSGSLEVAELKRDQIRGYGPDTYASAPVTFPLGCYVEPLA